MMPTSGSGERSNATQAPLLLQLQLQLSQGRRILGQASNEALPQNQ